VAKVILMISGLADVEVAGNQSLKNGIKYLSEFGYRIKVFTFMPENYPNLQDVRKIFNSDVEFHRLPVFLSFILNFGKGIKDLIGKRGKNFSQQRETVSNRFPGTYLREYNPVGRIFYIIFLFLLYIPIELSRVLIYSFIHKPDIIYGVNCQGAVVASLLGRLLKKPIITRFHGIAITEYDLAKWKNRVFVLDEIAGLTAKTNAVVMTNDGTKGDKILKILNVDQNKIFFWMNGLDVDNLRPSDDWNSNNFKKELGLENKKLILMTSRLATWKRVDRGIRCIYKLIKEHEMADIILLIAGNGPEKQNLENLTLDLGLKESVRFLGGIPHKEIFKYYSIADIFLSLFDISNLGNPLLEAMYFSLPIVTLDDGSTRHLLRNEYNSILVKIENSENELPIKVKMLLDDESLRKKIGQNTGETFKEKVLSWKERMELEHRLIQSLIGLNS
jgi:glycosyltransferase involved in cell wall biosynthesis